MTTIAHLHRIIFVVSATITLGPLAEAAPITFNTALPLSEDEGVVRQQIIYSHTSDYRLGVRREVDTFKSVSVAGYGVTSKLAVFGVVPIVKRDIETGPVSNSVSGLGDATLFARYQIYQKDGPGRTMRLAPFAGVVLPTGETGRTGDGSTDVFGGLVLTAASTDWNFDTQIKYVANGKANGLQRGNTISLDGSLQYRLHPGKIDAQTSGFLFTVIEASLSHAENDQRAGIDDANSGGDLLILSPGLQYATRRWIAEAAIRVPVLTNLNGTALAPDYSVLASLRVNF